MPFDRRAARPSVGAIWPAATTWPKVNGTLVWARPVFWISTSVKVGPATIAAGVATGVRTVGVVGFGMKPVVVLASDVPESVYDTASGARSSPPPPPQALSMAALSAVAMTEVQRAVRRAGLAL